MVQCVLVPGTVLIPGTRNRTRVEEFPLWSTNYDASIPLHVDFVPNGTYISLSVESQVYGYISIRRRCHNRGLQTRLLLTSVDTLCSIESRPQRSGPDQMRKIKRFPLISQCSLRERAHNNETTQKRETFERLPFFVAETNGEEFYTRWH